MSRTLSVSSEISSLNKVIVHRPDEGIARVSPKRSEELLFDDIVFLPRMQEEHDVFVAVLKSFVGKDGVLETRDLILESLEAHPEGKAELISLLVDFEELPTSFEKQLLELDNEVLTKVLVTGYDREDDFVYFDPIPNFIFTRDIAVMINDHCLITKASKTARYRENLLTRFFLWSHPLFADLKEGGKLINLNDLNAFPPSPRGEKVSIEGGDIMILNEDTLVIGTSERSTAHAFDSIKKVMFEKDIVENVVQVVVPPERSYMHIDTLFTQVDTNLFVAHKPIVVDGLSSYVTVHTKNGTERSYPSVEQFLKAEISGETEFVLGGEGRSPYQEREQWTDACNLLTIRPGVALAYDRNLMTEKAFKAKGYSILPALEFLSLVQNQQLDPDSLTKTIISLPSGELSRARGGSHCMSCPIDRA
ncbi:MAG: arginine deiminase family protein [Saprospiraceae bacterium]|nr:arginine deiminase family protein [Saprospiraceae bacterium]